MHTHRSGRLIKLARNVHLSRFRAPNKDFIDFFIPFSVSYGMALSLQRLVSVCPSLMLSKLFAWCSQAIHWSVVVIVGATANFFPATFSLSIRIAFFIILWGIWMRFFSSHLFFALRHCNNANNSKWLVRKERSFECKKKKYKRNELVKKPTYCQTHIYAKSTLHWIKIEALAECVWVEREREKKEQPYQPAISVVDARNWLF